MFHTKSILGVVEEVFFIDKETGDRVENKGFIEGTHAMCLLLKNNDRSVVYECDSLLVCGIHPSISDTIEYESACLFHSLILTHDGVVYNDKRYSHGEQSPLKRWAVLEPDKVFIHANKIANVRRALYREYKCNSKGVRYTNATGINKLSKVEYSGIPSVHLKVTIRGQLYNAFISRTREHVLITEDSNDNITYMYDIPITFKEGKDSDVENIADLKFSVVCSKVTGKCYIRVEELLLYPQINTPSVEIDYVTVLAKLVGDEKD